MKLMTTKDRARKAAGALALVAALGWALAGHPAAADPVGGVAEDTSTLPAGHIGVYHQEFYGGEEADVVAVGTGDIDIKVYDENGNLVASDTETDDTPMVSWTPSWTGRFTIKVINASHHSVAYSIRME